MGRKRKLEIASVENSSEHSNGSSSLNGIQRLAANDRERTRMRVLSKAFVRLKTSLPWVPNDTKLSKLDTLKLATSYISYLTRILAEDEDGEAVMNEPSFQQICHQPSKMLPSIRLSSFDMQKIINDHLSCHQQQSSSFVNTSSCSSSNNSSMTSSGSSFTANDFVSFRFF
jgi:hypothetical protein